MGAAAYNRGSEKIRREADERIAAIDPKQTMLAAQANQIDRLKEQVEKLQTKIERAKSAYERRNAEVEYLKVENREIAERAEMWHELATRYVADIERRDKKHLKLSRMVRELLSPSQVVSWREENKGEEV